MCSMAQMIQWFDTSKNAADSSCIRPHPQISHCPGEGWRRAVWRFPRSHSLWTWGSSELNGSERIPSHRHVLHSWCSYPDDVTFKTKCELLSTTNKDRVLFSDVAVISVPWSGSNTLQRFQETESFSAQLTCPSACSKRCGSFSPEAPAHESTFSSQQEHLHSVTSLAHIQTTSLLTWRQTLDFSSRYCSTRAPSMAPPLVKLMSMYFPKRLELSFRIVLAFPKAGKKANQVKRGFHGLWRPSYNFICWRLARTLQDRVRFKNLLLDPGVLAAHCSQELQHELGVLSFPCSWLPTGEENKELSI